MPAAAPAPARPPRASDGARLYRAHQTAARRLGIPELAIEPAEADDAAAALADARQLLGLDVTSDSPFFTWLSVIYTLGMIYGGRVLEIAARRRREAAAAPPAAPARSPAPAAPAPAAPIKPMPTIAMPAGADLDPNVGMVSLPTRIASETERLGPL